MSKKIIIEKQKNNFVKDKLSEMYYKGFMKWKSIFEFKKSKKSNTGVKS